MQQNSAENIRELLNFLTEVGFYQQTLENENNFGILAELEEAWSKKYKKSINCKNPKGFSQKAHCAGRKKRQAHGKTRSASINETWMKK